MGYAVYCMFLEHLGSCDFFVAKWDLVEKEIIAGDFGVSVTEMTDIIDFCGRLGLIQIDNETIKCQSLTDRLKDLTDKRERERNRVSVAETTQPVAETPQSKVKESKGKKIKEIILSKDSAAIAEIPKKWPDPEIDNVLSCIKEKMAHYKIAYSPKDERMFGKHLLSNKRKQIASQYKFETWVDFAKFVIDCSMQEGNRWNYKICSAKDIYQKFAQVINDRQKVSQKAVMKQF